MITVRELLEAQALQAIREIEDKRLYSNKGIYSEAIKIISDKMQIAIDNIRECKELNILKEYTPENDHKSFYDKTFKGLKNEK